MVRPLHSLEMGMFVREYGTRGAAGTVLWVHGLGESGLCFEGIAPDPRLSSWHHLVPDLPGYGRSPWQDSPIPLAQLAGLLARWFQEREKGPAVLVGHSMGGTLGQLFGESCPKLLRAFVNVEGNICLDDCTASGRAAAYPLEAFLSVGFGAMQDGLYKLGESDAAFRGAYASMRLCDPRSFHLHARELVELSRKANLALRMAALPVPKVYVAGSPGGAPAGSLRLLQTAGVALATVEPSGHWPFIDRPAAFAEVLADFLRGREIGSD